MRCVLQASGYEGQGSAAIDRRLKALQSAGAQMDAMPMAGIDGARAADVSGAYAVLIDGGSACRAVAAWALPSSLSLRACSPALPTRGLLLWVRKARIGRSRGAAAGRQWPAAVHERCGATWMLMRPRAGSASLMPAGFGIPDALARRP